MTDRNQLEELTKVIAVELTAITSQLWRADIDPERWTTRIYCADAFITLHLDQKGRETRLRAYPATPKGITPLNDHDSITLNANRKPEAIAQDIHRRLYAEAQTYLERCTEHQMEIDRKERIKQLTLNLLSRYLPERGMYESRHAPRIRAEIRGDHIELRIDATKTEAMQILKLLRG